MYCKEHKEKLSVGVCKSCGAEICKSCYDLTVALAGDEDELDENGKQTTDCLSCHESNLITAKQACTNKMIRAKNGFIVGLITYLLGLGMIIVGFIIINTIGFQKGFGAIGISLLVMLAGFLIAYLPGHGFMEKDEQKEKFDIIK